MNRNGSLLYFNYLFEHLQRRNPSIEASFGRHVHWGYWEQPETATDDDADYAVAAERMTSEICALAGIADGDRVLDVGCGFGGTLAYLNERHSALSLTGLNIEFRQVERARQIVVPVNDNNIAYCLADACQLPFADSSIDRVLAVEAIFHFPSRPQFLQEAFRVLRPGGTLALSDFVPSLLLLPAATLVSEPRRLGRFAYFGRCHVLHTIGRYRRAAARAGFGHLAERNVTRHTLPTYRYLQQLLLQRARIEGLTEWAARAVGLVGELAAIGQLNYYLMAFRKSPAGLRAEAQDDAGALGAVARPNPGNRAFQSSICGVRSKSDGWKDGLK